jgi:hypothetical protein
MIKIDKNHDNKSDFEPLMDDVTIKDFKGKIIKFKPKHIQGYGFTVDGKSYNFVAFKNSININIPLRSHIFMLTIEEGEITLYQYFFEDFLMGVKAKGSFYFISKNSSDLIKLDENSDLINAISDDDELHTSLEKSNIFLKDIPIIIKRYNSHKTKKIIKEANPPSQLETYDE